MNRILLTLALHVLATPVYAVIAIRKLLRARRGAAVLRRGTVLCPYDGTSIPLARMNICTCGYVSASSLVLPCEFCGQAPGNPAFVECLACGATVPVFVP